MRGRRGRRLGPVGVAAAVAFALVITACGGGDEEAGGGERRLEEPPEEVVWYLLGEMGPETAVVGAADARALAISAMGSAGTPRPEAECVLAAGIPLVGGDAAFAELTVSELTRFKKTATRATEDPAAEAALDDCVSSESVAREEAREISPDFDLAEARRLGAVVAEANGLAVGLTEEEARCYADGAFRSLTDDFVRRIVSGQLEDGEWDRATVIEDCMTEERIEEVAAELEEEFLAERARRAQEEKEFQEEVDRLLASTTTLPPGVTPTAPTIPEGIVGIGGG